MLQIVVIGYKNHAERVINILCEIHSVELVMVYHPDSKKIIGLSKNTYSKIQFTSSWNSLINSDAFFICSPSETHMDYISKIFDSHKKNNFLPYVYCEKPAATSKKELNWIKSKSQEFYKTLYFGFNYRFSSLMIQLKKTIASGGLGTPIYANFNISHGIAFKKEMGENWRFSNPSVFSKITGNLGIHYVDMCISLFGSIKNVSITERNIAKNSQPDTAIINLFFESGMICNIFLSYATVFSQTADIFFTNGLLKENNDKIDIFSPRDTFNKDGEFCQPKALQINLNYEFNNSKSGLNESISYFMSKVENDCFFNKKEYDQSLNASEIFLN